MGSTGPIGIAPVDAPGSIVYWYTNGYTGAIGLNGFAAFDETVAERAHDERRSLEAQVTCIGCHVGTPDGNSVVFSSWNGNWGNLLSDIDTGDGGTPGAVPSYAGNARPPSRSSKVRSACRRSRPRTGTTAIASSSPRTATASSNGWTSA